jgi:hypothetical protein
MHLHHQILHVHKVYPHACSHIFNRPILIRVQERAQVTCLDSVLLMVRSRTRFFCFVDKLLAYVTSSIPQVNTLVRRLLWCSLEGGTDVVGSGSCAVWSRQQTAGLTDSSQKELSAIHFSLILNKFFLKVRFLGSLWCALQTHFRRQRMPSFLWSYTSIA